MLPDFDFDGDLPPGIHAAPLAEVGARFGAVVGPRARQWELLRQVVAAAGEYATLKRVLVWGSFVTSTAKPNDLDYSVIAGVSHRMVDIAPEHRRFLVPSEARRQYGADAGYALLYDFPLERHLERMDFLCQNREGKARGIVEIHLRGETAEANDRAIGEVR